MIAVDTSALVAIVREEPSADDCFAALTRSDLLLISAGTLVEIRIVSLRRNVAYEMRELLRGLSPEIVPVDADTAARIERIYRTWGKNFHAASLNFGDCFAYDVAHEHRCPLLYVGNDFAQTDVASAM